MDLGWLHQLLTLLFGQVGVLGTILIGMVAGMFWLLLKEQEAHGKTRTSVQEVNEKRLELALSTLKTLEDLTGAIEALGDKVERMKSVRATQNHRG